LPNNKSTEKRRKQNIVKRLHNKGIKSEVRTSIKVFQVSVKEQNNEAAEANFKTMVKLIDTAARKGLYHVNAASRKKSRMNKLLNSLKA